MIKRLLALFVIFHIAFFQLAYAANEDFDSINKDFKSVKVSKEERVAIRLASKMVDAFEKRDIQKLKSVNVRVQDQTNDEVQKMFDNMNSMKAQNFKLHNVEVSSSTIGIVAGEFTYSFQLEPANSVGKTINISTTAFRCVLCDGKPMLLVEPTKRTMNESFEKQAAGIRRFGVDDIRKLE
jgi:hypothetical protein